MSGHVHDGRYGHSDPTCPHCQKEAAAEQAKLREFFQQISDEDTKREFEDEQNWLSSSDRSE
jgi:hypothetical protein